MDRVATQPTRPSTQGAGRPEGAGERVVVAVVTPLDAELLEPIRAVSDAIELLYEPDLLPAVRYPGDYHGVEGFSRDADGERRWQELLGRAEVLFGLPGDSPAGLAAVVRSNPSLRWVQGTAAGTGEQVKAAGLTAEELERVMITSASGVHVGPLAEFCLMGLLAFTKDLPRLRADQQAHHWDHYPVAELRGGTLLILGLGAIGTEVARLAKAFGMHTIGVNRRGVSESPHVDEAYASDDLHDLLGRPDAIVVTLPLTEETAGMLDAQAIGRLKPDAILVNAGRGGVIDEPALTQALRAHPAERRRARGLRHRAVTDRQPAVGPAQRADQPPHRRPLGARERAHRRAVLREPAPLPRRRRAAQPRRHEAVLLMRARSPARASGSDTNRGCRCARRHERRGGVG